MFIYTITPCHSNPVDTTELPTIFASTWAQVGRLIRKHSEAHVGLFDDVRNPGLHTDFALYFRVTKGAEDSVVIVKPAVTADLTIELFVSSY